MANEDSSQYVLRWNEITPELEFKAGLNWVSTGVGAAGLGITQLTGDVTAGPGSGSQAAIVHSASGTFTVNTTTQTTTLSQEIINEAASHLALSFVGTAVDSSTSTDGVGIYLMHNGTNNRQLGFVDSANASGSEPTIRFVLNNGSPSIDVVDFNLSSAGVVPLTLGNSTNGIVSPGLINTTAFKLNTSPTSGFILTSDSAGNGTWQAASGGTLVRVALTSQSADISSTPLFTAASTGLYQVNVYMTCTTADAGAGANQSFNISYTDDSGAQTSSDLTGLDSTADGAFQPPVTSTLAWEVVSGHSLSYSVTGGGTYGAARYSLYITVVKL